MMSEHLGNLSPNTKLKWGIHACLSSTKSLYNFLVLLPDELFYGVLVSIGVSIGIVAALGVVDRWGSGIACSNLLVYFLPALS